MRKMLNKDPAKRIAMQEIKNHRWVTCNGRMPMTGTVENCHKVTITDDDVKSSVKHIPKLDTLVSTGISLHINWDKERKAVMPNYSCTPVSLSHSGCTVKLLHKNACPVATLLCLILGSALMISNARNCSQLNPRLSLYHGTLWTVEVFIYYGQSVMEVFQWPNAQQHEAQCMKLQQFI